MPRILIAADGHWMVDEVVAALPGADFEVAEISRGLAVLPWLQENDADLIVLDMQIGSMGGIAVCHELRLEENAGRLDRIPVLVLLDRRADVFLARRIDAEGWLVKPLDPIRIRRAISTLLGGGTYYDPSWAPSPILTAPTLPAPTLTGPAE